MATFAKWQRASGIENPQELGLAQSLFQELSALRQPSIRRYHGIGFGGIGTFPPCDGEPILTPETEIVLNVKLDADDRLRLEQSLTDLELCKETLRLFAHSDSLRSYAATLTRR